MNQKVRIARLSIFSNLGLIFIKMIAGLMSGSISIISEAVHSMMDLAASFIAFFSVKISDAPADNEHPYGHGKFENVSGVAEAMLIFVAAIWIIYKAIHKLMDPTELESLHIGIGFVVMTVSAIVNFIVSRKLYKVSRETDSIALEADALHLKTDVYTSAGVAAGLLLIWVGGLLTSSRVIHYLDPVIAIFVALLILYESYILFSKAFNPLLDVALSEKEIQLVKATIDRHCNEEISYHNLRTRKAGNFRYIDFHLMVPPDKTVKEAHDLCDEIELNIREVLADAEVTIHVEVDNQLH